MKEQAKKKADELYYETFGSFIGDNKICKRACLKHVDGIIKELEQLRKPEYTSFVIKYSLTDPIVMDGYEKIHYWAEVRAILERS